MSCEADNEEQLDWRVLKERKSGVSGVFEMSEMHTMSKPSLKNLSWATTC
jgi:hypothetical protein